MGAVPDDAFALGAEAAVRCRQALQEPYDAARCQDVTPQGRRGGATGAAQVLAGTQRTYSYLHDVGMTHCKLDYSQRCSRLADLMADVPAPAERGEGREVAVRAARWWSWASGLWFWSRCWSVQSGWKPSSGSDTARTDPICNKIDKDVLHTLQAY